MAQLVNVIAPILTNEKRIFLQTIYYTLALFANNTKGKALELLVKGPVYKSRNFDSVPHPTPLRLWTAGLWWSAP
jgi:alpha-N-arabinofuranosidase